MKGKILAAFALEHPELEFLDTRAGIYRDIRPSVSTALYDDITDKEGNVKVKQDDDFILLTGVEL